MENDIYKIGYRISDPNKLNIADSNRFSYKADVNNDGTADSVRYYLGSTSQVKFGTNSNDRPLLKVVNGGTASIMGMVSALYFKYYDSTGRQISSYGLNSTILDTLKKVRVVNVYIKCESPYLINNYYQTAEYSRKIKPVNLK
jgi:hypothetical protein